MQQTITTLSNQVNKLNDKLSAMQDDDRYQRDMERLTRAEQRAEQIRSQLIDIQSQDCRFRIDIGTDRICVATGEHRELDRGLWKHASGTDSRCSQETARG